VALLFDLDNTLYPASLPVVARIDERINRYLHERVGVALEEVDALRRRFWASHGTTLAGLMVHHRVDPDDYLSYVHAIDVDDLLAPDADLRAVLERLSGRKLVFTNASRVHAEKVLDRLGLGGVFEAVVALEDRAYAAKPEPASYSALLARFKLEGERCTMIDDALKNLAAAKTFGMRTVWVSAVADRGSEAVDHVVAAVHAIEALAGAFS
jgi:putative hydrolase of the HAD superfamily